MVKFSFRQQVLAGFAVSIILVLIVGILSYKSIHQLESDSDRVEHTEKVIETSSNLLQLMIDAETGMRGFVATNKVVFLDPYSAALPGITRDVDQLKMFSSQNQSQTQRVDSLVSFVNLQLNILKENIAVRPQKGLDFMVQNNMLLNGKHNMDQIRLLVAEIKKTELDLLAIRKASSNTASSRALNIIIGGSLVFLIIILILFLYIQRTFEQQKKIEKEITVANGELEKVLNENTAKNWLLTGTGLLNEKMQGQQSEKELSENIIKKLCKYTEAAAGTFYLYNENLDVLELYASCAVNDLTSLKSTVKISENWLGQAAADQRTVIVKGKLNENIKLSSSLIADDVLENFIVPFYYDKKLKGVIELAYKQLTGPVKEYISLVSDIIGIALNTSQARTIMHELLMQVQQQAEELEAQQEEMRVTNEELLSKTEMLQASEEELRVQQEQLSITNVELEEKASLLEEKNRTIEEARSSISVKAQELETTGKYKSEFLANMSHELRTPLNSILVLARILKDNKPANLTEDQIKYSSVIFNCR